MLENTHVPPQNEEYEPLHHAGDKGFKVAMKVKETALEYMEKFFPKLYAHLDLTTFELDNTNYVTKDFEEYYSDVVYRTFLKPTSTTKKRPVAVALLFEHKKTIRSYFVLFLQLLEYIVYLWKEDLANKRKPSIIIPIVVFQGKRGLKVRQLHDCFKGIPQDILQYVPNFECHLTNVQSLPDEKILDLNESGLLRSLFLAYSYTEKKEQIKGILIEVFKFFKHSPDRFDFFQLIFEFLSKEDYLSADETNELFAHYLSPPLKEGIMTTYQYYVQQGIQEGEQKGETKKARQTVLRGRWKDASTDLLADISELPYVEVENLVKGYDEVYELWKKNKGQVNKMPKIAHLAKEEVEYLVNLFNMAQS